MHSVTIEDRDSIKHFINRISTIPANGDMMISFGPKAEEVDLEFHCGSEIQTIGIYAQRFKTPSTGFNSGENEAETSLYQDIEALLLPDFNKNMLKIKNLVLPFRGFSITYLGSAFEDFAPATVSITKDNFLIKDHHGNEQLVQISSGQLPPQPRRVEINHKKITLLTFEAPSQVRLYPHYFQITK